MLEHDERQWSGLNVRFESVKAREYARKVGANKHVEYGGKVGKQVQLGEVEGNSARSFRRLVG